MHGATGRTQENAFTYKESAKNAHPSCVHAILLKYIHGILLYPKIPWERVRAPSMHICYPVYGP